MIQKFLKTVEQMNESRSWFFEKLTELINPQPDLPKKERERTQINKMRNEKGQITTNTAERNTITGECIMSNYIPINWAIWRKCIDPQKHINHQN